MRIAEEEAETPAVEPQADIPNGGVVEQPDPPIAKISKDEFPSGDKAVYIFLEMIALGFALEAVASFMRGDVWWRWIGALVLGVLFLVAGVKWLQIKLLIAPRLVSILEHVANNRLYRRAIYTAIVLAILLSSGFGIYRRYSSDSTSDKDTSSTDTSGPPQPLTPLESLTVSPIKLVFKDQAIGKTSNPQTVLVVNRGNAPRIITGINAIGNFSQTNDCGSELLVGDSCNVEVTFTPKTSGLMHGNLEISGHDPLFSSINLLATVDFSGSGKIGKPRVQISNGAHADNNLLEGKTNAGTISVAQPEEAAPQVRQPFDPNALPEFMRPKPLMPDLMRQPPSPARAKASDEILEEIRAVLEKDRESDEMQGCPTGTSVELRMVGNDISYYLCIKQCFAAWRKVNLKDLDFGDVKVSQPFDDHRLAVVEIPCLHPGTVAGLCLTEEVGTFPSKECIKKNLKTNYYQSFRMTIHANNVDSLVRLWKEFAQVGP